MVSHLNTFADRGVISVKGTKGRFLSWELGFTTIQETEIPTEFPSQTALFGNDHVCSRSYFSEQMCEFTLGSHGNIYKNPEIWKDFCHIMCFHIRNFVHKCSLKKKKKTSVIQGKWHLGQNTKQADSTVNPKQPPRRSVCQQGQQWRQPKKSATNPDTAAGKTHSRSYTPLPSPPHDYSHGLWRTQRKKVKRNRINIAYIRKRQSQGNTKITRQSHFALFLHYFNADSSYRLSKLKGDFVIFGTKPGFLSKHDNGPTLHGLLPQRIPKHFTNLN